MTDLRRTFMHWCGICSLGGSLLGLADSPAVAQQQLTVQQPSFETFSGATTVSVPNRGRTLIGGVSRGASGSSNYGPFRSGINSGRAFSGSSVSAHVRIHDFAEMDRQILESASGRRSQQAADDSRPSDIRLADQSEHAYQVLVKGKAGASGSGGSGPATISSRHPGVTDSAGDAHARDDGESAAEAERLFQKGRRAVAAGNDEVARVWFRLAEKRGSAAAAAELRRPEQQTRVANAKK